MKLKIILLLRLKKENQWANLSNISKYIVVIISKYTASFDYFDKSLIVLSVMTGSIYIASFSTGIVKKLLKTTRSKKKKA